MSLFQTLSGVFQPGQQPSAKEAAKPQKFRPIFKKPAHQLSQSENQLAKDEASVETAQKFVKDQQAQVQVNLGKLEELKTKYSKRIQEIAKLGKDEARDIIFKSLEKRLAAEIAKSVTSAEDRAREEASDRAREIIVDALKHGATEYVAEYTVSIVKLPSEDSKGRIIGKEGRNIRAFTNTPGVDLDLDESPGEVRLSSFDPVRREIARIALQRLLADGRIQPTRIEEYVQKAKKEIEKIMFEEGRKLCHAVGVYTLPQELIGMLGRFKYRFSYGQNMIAHTLEETKIGIALAHEIGADVDTVRLGCLLHDIGKIITDQEGTHIELGVELLKKHMMPQAVIDCVAQHHEDTPFSSVESQLVYIADAISGSRPGARYEDIEGYIKRLSDIEQIAKSNEGVKEVFAFQAGRELRVLVEPQNVDDAKATIIANKIAKEIESKLTYPGQIRVTVIREFRAIDVAK